MKYWWSVLAVPLVVVANAYSAAVPSCSENPDFPVCVEHEIIDAKSCHELILAAEESGAFDRGFDSLDGKPAMQIDIVEWEVVEIPKLFQLVEPYLEKLRAFIAKHFDVSFVYWIFLRKYSYQGNHGRKGVRFHSDNSGATAVVPLNNDYKDGAYVMVDKKFDNENFKGEFSIPEQEKTSSSTYYRPPLRTGSALIHDGEILHGVEAVSQGTRYSLIFFFAVDEVVAEFRNDLDRHVTIYQIEEGKERYKIFDLPPRNLNNVVTKPNDFFVGVDLDDKVVVEWKIGHAPRLQVYKTSTPILHVDNDSLKELLGEDFDKWSSSHPAGTYDKAEKEL